MSITNDSKNIRKNLNPWVFVSFIFVFLIIFLCLALFLNVSGWLYTYNVLTEERVIGELTISKKVIKDGVPSGTARLVLYKQETLVNLNVFDNTKHEKEIIDLNFDFSGDQIFVDSYFIRWQNWLTMFGFKPIYKIYRVKSDFIDSEKAKNYKRDVIDLSVNQDKLFFNFFDNANTNQFLSIFVQGAFISSVGQNITNTEQKFNIVVTNDAIVLEPK